MGNSEFYFPRISIFHSTLRFSGNKIHCSPRDQLLSVKLRLQNVYGGQSSKGFLVDHHLLLSKQGNDRA